MKDDEKRTSDARCAWIDASTGRRCTRDAGHSSDGHYDYFGGHEYRSNEALGKCERCGGNLADLGQRLCASCAHRTQEASPIWPNMPAWSCDNHGDTPLAEDANIADAFPTRSGRHATYAEAMRLVGARRSKAGLVALVHWLLVRHDRTLERHEGLALEAMVKAGEPRTDNPDAVADERERCARLVESLANMVENGAGPLNMPAARLRQAAQSIRAGKRTLLWTPDMQTNPEHKIPTPECGHSAQSWVIACEECGATAIGPHPEQRVDYPRSVAVGVEVRERLSGVVTEIYSAGSHLDGYAKVEWDEGRYWNNRPVECLVPIDAPRSDSPKGSGE